MNYIISIKTAILVFPFIALLFSIPFILHQYHKYGSINPFRVLIIYSFILYMITIFFLVILPLPTKKEVVYKPNMIKLIPFGFINDFIKESSFVLTDPRTYLKALTEPCFYTVLFNIFMTIPFGMYLRYYFKCNFKKTIMMSLVLSLFFELTQLTGLYHFYPYQYRVFDVDDLIMNTLGGMIGYFIMGFIDNFLPTRDEIDRESLIAGECVSGLRRITLFGLDCFIYMFITLLISIFFHNRYLMVITFITYYIIYPYFRNGETLGGRFLNVRLEFQRFRLIKITLRIVFLYVYYFGSLLIIIALSLFITERLNLELLYSSWLCILTMIGMVLFYLINVFGLIKNRKAYYDKIFKIKYISTIEQEDDAK